VAEVFLRHGDVYRRGRDGRLDGFEQRVMSAFDLCRTAALRGYSEICSKCGLVRCAHNSCRNLHCPTCQGHARAELLPVS
jgi:hypothetical protein